MDDITRIRIRYIFLTPRPSVALMTAADHLGMSLKELKKEIEDGAIVAVSTRTGVKVSKEELMAAAMRVWEQAVIEEALGEDAASVLPEAIRLVELRARVPRYQREMLQVLARIEGTSVDYVLTRELEDVASARMPRSWRGWRDSRWPCSGRQVRLRNVYAAEPRHGEPRNASERLSLGWSGRILPVCMNGQRLRQDLLS